MELPLAEDYARHATGDKSDSEDAMRLKSVLKVNDSLQPAQFLLAVSKQNPANHSLEEKRRKSFWPIAGLSALLLMVATALPASALTYSENQLAWAGCSWAKHNYSVNVTATGYPANGVASDNGGVTSFTSRIRDAVGEWNSVTSKGRIPYNVDYDNSRTTDILFRSVNPADGGADTIGYTYIQRQGKISVTGDFYGTCPRKSQGDLDFIYARIDTKVMGSWFTQGSTKRSYWENCNNRTAGAPYSTCSKKDDFGSLATHELGHAMGQAHPETAAEFSRSAARCKLTNGKPDSPFIATMCPTLPIYRTEGRTLETWDRDAYTYHTYFMFR